MGKPNSFHLSRSATIGLSAAAGILGILSFGLGLAALGGTLAGMMGVSAGIGASLTASAGTAAATATGLGVVGGAFSVMTAQSQYNEAVQAHIGVKAAKKNLIMSSVGLGLSGLDAVGSVASLSESVNAVRLAKTAGALGFVGGVGLGVTQTTQGIQKGSWKEVGMGLGSLGMAGVGVYAGARVGARAPNRGVQQYDMVPQYEMVNRGTTEPPPLEPIPQAFQRALERYKNTYGPPPPRNPTEIYNIQHDWLTAPPSDVIPTAYQRAFYDVHERTGRYMLGNQNQNVFTKQEPIEFDKAFSLDIDVESLEEAEPIPYPIISNVHSELTEADFYNILFYNQEQRGIFPVVARRIRWNENTPVLSYQPPRFQAPLSSGQEEFKE
jgi:hypothetical protein